MCGKYATIIAKNLLLLIFLAILDKITIRMKSKYIKNIFY